MPNENSAQLPLDPMSATSSPLKDSQVIPPVSAPPPATPHAPQEAPPPQAAAQPQTSSQPTQSAKHLSISRIKQTTPWIGYCLLGGVLLSIWRFLDMNNPLSWAVNSALFTLGALLGHLLFVFEASLSSKIDQVSSRLADDDQTDTNNASEQSLLRQIIILLILPILAFYLISSSGSPLGLGFLFGISCVYLRDVVSLLSGQQQKFIDEYFKRPPSDQQLQLTSLFYLAYFIFLLFALSWWK